MRIEKRSVAVCIILCFVTCGLYGLWWMSCMTNDLNNISGRVNDTSGGMAVLLMIVTCGLYTFYWMYRAGEKIDMVRQARGMVSQNNGLLYCLLTLFGFGIISYALAQSELNRLADMQ